MFVHVCVCVCISTWQHPLSPLKKVLLYTNCIHCFCVYTFMDVVPLTESSIRVIIIVSERGREKQWESLLCVWGMRIKANPHRKHFFKAFLSSVISKSELIQNGIRLGPRPRGRKRGMKIWKHTQGNITPAPISQSGTRVHLCGVIPHYCHYFMSQLVSEHIKIPQQRPQYLYQIEFSKCVSYYWKHS